MTIGTSKPFFLYFVPDACMTIFCFLHLEILQTVMVAKIVEIACSWILLSWFFFIRLVSCNVVVILKLKSLFSANKNSHPLYFSIIQILKSILYKKRIPILISSSHSSSAMVLLLVQCTNSSSIHERVTVEFIVPLFFGDILSLHKINESIKLLVWCVDCYLLSLYFVSMWNVCYLCCYLLLNKLPYQQII